MSGWSNNIPSTQEIPIIGLSINEYPFGVLNYKYVSVDDIEHIKNQFNNITKIDIEDNKIICHAYTEIPDCDIPILIKRNVR